MESLSNHHELALAMPFDKLRVTGLLVMLTQVAASFATAANILPVCNW